MAAQQAQASLEMMKMQGRPLGSPEGLAPAPAGRRARTTKARGSAGRQRASSTMAASTASASSGWAAV